MTRLIDTHHHFWDPATADYPWMTDDLAVIRRKFSPDDLRPRIAEVGVTDTILVQTRSSYEESLEFLEIADATDFVAGVVAWVDLTSQSVADDLQRLKDSKGGAYLVGIRHQVHDEEDPNWLLRADVRRGLAAVARHDLVYDLLLRPRELPAAIKTVQAMPETRWVLDHIAKPEIASGGWEPWASDLRALAEASSNCWVKLSGMVTEADWTAWTADDLAPYLNHVVDCFGAGRCMLGSDWPVCLLAAPYDRVMTTAVQLIAELAEPAQRQIRSETAIAAYKLGLD
ncbi:amidohydrolase family protein [Jannaschia seohaensis]|uniref:L-fuconolactonase n=1 Tax=Jannaschia seohaensis TaxID=475081 RepID=A0A2Y9B431_9RHOB|nr:amidohydrolase family protein [Jannaschia seohaensis]PWJ11748.1 L-fuconolactonase [Jannaschia seohaensis]SSA51264.1 L-fuconolactonase [Jannaschia seohaensis]